MKLKFWWLFAVALAGCGSGETSKSSASAIARVDQPLGAVAVSATKRLGESCRQFGRAECATGLCLRVRPEPVLPGVTLAANEPASHVCVTACSAPSDCPKGWGCREVMPYKRACVPPARFVAKAVEVTR